jgi:hypothetical protein
MHGRAGSPVTEKIEKPVDGQTASYKKWKIDL